MPGADVLIDRCISHYRILYPLGSGGMGDVYAGLDETLKRRVALKAIRPEHRLNEDSKARFLREARILSQLDHPSICRVYDYIGTDDGDWLVLELIEGSSLRSALERGLEPAARMRIAEQVAAVLLVTHAAGVVHRDLKPGNVMLAASGDVKVLDFGLARSLFVAAAAVPAASAAAVSALLANADVEVTRSSVGQASSDASVSHFQTARGAITGTLAYMSPEQARGEEATPASDLYSFGVMLQEIFTGRRAYPDGLDYLQLLDKVQGAGTLPVSGVGADLAALITRLKSASAAQRPTALDVTERLAWIREAPKRRTRNALIAAAVGILILGGIKYTIDLARERTAAVSARQDADRRRDQAEALIGFMLGDLRGKLRQVGRLELLEEVGQKAMTYFAAVPAATLSGEELFRRSQALHQIGQIRQERGDLPGAMSAYRESLDLAKTVAARDPGNHDWQVGLVTAHFYVGDALRRQGDLDGAMREFSAYRDVARRLVDRDPQNVQSLLELSYGHSNVAAVLEAQGDLAGAARELRLSLAIQRQLTERDPSKRDWQRAVATSFNRLGVVLDKLGQSDEALRHYQGDLETRRRLVAGDRRDNSIKRSLLVAHSYVARAHEERAEIADALTHLNAALAVGTELVTIDSTNADWRRELAITRLRLGMLQRVAGDRAAARAECRSALDILRPIAEASPSHLARQSDLANALVCVGHLQLDEGNVTGAEASSAAATRTLAPLAAKKVDQDTVVVTMNARLFAAAVADRRGDAAGALRLREEVVTLAAAGGTRTPDKRRLAALARALIALKRLDEARSIIANLATLGYRHPALMQEWRRAGAAGSE